MAKHEVPEGALGATPSREALAASLKEMLDVYWGEGDGAEPPQFIQQAQILVRNFYAERSE